MKRALTTAACSLALLACASPALAQAKPQPGSGDVLSTAETDRAVATIENMLGDIFGAAEDLTAQQQARLPVAMQVAAQLMPEGVYARMMDETMTPMMDTMMGGFSGTPAVALSELTGLNIVQLAEINDKRLEDALMLLDPDASERGSAMTESYMEMITEVMNEIEPAYRAGLARAYAVRFTKEELLDLNGYFSTPVGSKYAGESFLIYSDPQVMASMNEMIPAMVDRMPGMVEDMAEAAAKFPAGRSFSDLDAGEQARLAELLGVTPEELEDAQPEVDSEDALEEA